MPFTPTCSFCGAAIAGRLNRVDNRECCDPCFAKKTGRIVSNERREQAIERYREREQLEARAKKLNDGSRLQRKQYKVLTQLDSFFSGVFTPAKIEDAVNHYAAQGWTVVSMASIGNPGSMMVSHQLVVLFERDFIHPDSLSDPQQ